MRAPSHALVAPISFIPGCDARLGARFRASFGSLFQIWRWISIAPISPIASGPGIFKFADGSQHIQVRGGAPSTANLPRASGFYVKLINV